MKRVNVLIAILLTTLVAASDVALQTTGPRPADERIKLESDGWEIIGELRIPKSDSPVPAVVLLHQANGTRDVYIEMAALLSERGIASFRVDLRAHGESTNKGKFGPPFDEKMRELLVGSENDVTVIHNFLREHPKIDGERIGFVGASYTGERIARSGRMTRYGKAYVQLSPGDFSDESIDAVDKSGVPWFFIRSIDERDFFNELYDAIREKSRTATVLELPGKHHATRILENHPEMAEMIAIWFKQMLSR